MPVVTTVVAMHTIMHTVIDTTAAQTASSPATPTRWPAVSATPYAWCSDAAPWPPSCPTSPA